MMTIFSGSRFALGGGVPSPTPPPWSSYRSREKLILSGFDIYYANSVILYNILHVEIDGYLFGFSLCSSWGRSQ